MLSMMRESTTQSFRLSRTVPSPLAMVIWEKMPYVLLGNARVAAAVPSTVVLVAPASFVNTHVRSEYNRRLARSTIELPVRWKRNTLLESELYTSPGELRKLSLRDTTTAGGGASIS